MSEKYKTVPVAYAVFADNGNIRIWSADPIQAKTLVQEYGDQVRPLYAAPQPLPDVTALVEALERIMTWPDGGRHYGQSKIKVFAAEALAAYRKQGGEP